MYGIHYNRYLKPTGAEYCMNSALFSIIKRSFHIGCPDTGGVLNNSGKKKKRVTSHVLV